MADLGTLYFDILLRDKTEEEIKKMRERILKDLTTDLKLEVDQNALRASIDAAIKNKSATLKVGIDKEQISKDMAGITLKPVKATVGVKSTELRKSIQEALNNAQFKATVGATFAKAQVKQAAAEALKNVQIPTGLKLTADTRELVKTLQEKLNEKKFKITVEVEKVTLSERVKDELRKAGANPSAFNNGAANAAKATRQYEEALKNLGLRHREVAGIIGSFRNQLLGVYSIYTIEQFLQQLIAVGGEFQKQRIALETMLGSAAKATEIFAKIKALAVESPFNFKDLTGYAKQLSAFSIPYNELYETTRRLADISAGLGVDMGRIILAFGQVRSAAFLRGAELRQFTEAGIPLLDKLAAKLTMVEGRAVSVGEVFERISKREISFQMVKDALWEMTDEGGQFYKMQEALTESLSGQMDKLKDSYQIMLSEIANENNSFIGGALSLITKLMGAWRMLYAGVTMALGGWIAYKAVVLASGVITAKQIIRTFGLTAATSQDTIVRLQNVMAMNVQNKAALRFLVTMGRMQEAIGRLSKAGWIGILVAGITALSVAAYHATQNASKLRRELEKINEKAGMEVESLTYRYASLLEKLKATKQGTKEYADVIAQLNSGFGQYLNRLWTEVDAYKDIAASIRDVTAAIIEKKRNEAYENKISTIEDDYTEKFADEEKDIAWRIRTAYQLKDDKTAKAMAEDVVAFIRMGKTAEEAMRQVAKNYNLAFQSLYKESVKNASGGAVPFTGGNNPAEDYEKLFKEYQNELRNAARGLPGMGGMYTDELKKISEEYDKRSRKLSPDEDVQRKNELDKVKAQLKMLRDKGLPNNSQAIIELESQKKTLEEAGETWILTSKRIMRAKKEINGVSISLEGLAPTEKEYIDRLAYLERLAAKLKESRDFVGSMELIKSPTEAEKRQTDRAKETIRRILELQKLMGVNVQDFGKTGAERGEGGGGTKDAFAEQMRERLSLIKDAYSEYQKWQELVGRDRAIAIMKKSDVFGSLFTDTAFDPSKLRENVLGVMNSIQSKIKESGGDTKARRDLLKEGQKIVYDIEYDTDKASLEKALSDAQREIDRELKSWELFKKVRDVTGNKELAYNVAFSTYSSPKEPDMEGLYKRQFDKAMNSVGFGGKYTFDILAENGTEGIPRPVKELFDATRERIEQMKSDATELFTSILEQYKSVSDEILAIEEERTRKVAAIRGARNEGRITTARAEKLEQLVNQEADFAKFQKSAEYLNFFNAGLVMTKEAARQAGEAIKKELDERFQDGTLSVNDYVDSLKKVQEQLDTIESQKGDIGNYLEGGFVKMFEERYKKAEAQFNSAQTNMRQAEGAYWGAKERKEVAESRGDAVQARAAQEDMNNAELDIANAKIQIQKAKQDMGDSSDDKTAMEAFLKIVQRVGKAFQVMESGLQDIGNMMDALGVDTRAGTKVGNLLGVGNIVAQTGGKAAGAVASFMSGDFAGAITNGIGAITGAIAGAAKLHDAKLQTQIENLQSHYKDLDAVVTIVEGSIDRALGSGAKVMTDEMKGDLANAEKARDIIERLKADNPEPQAFFDLFNLQKAGVAIEDIFKREQAIQEGGAFGYQRQLLGEQLKAVEKQRDLAEQMKKKDEDQIRDYDQQIAELRAQILDFAKDTAKELYGIDVKSWAQELGDALFEAWKKGEDGATAFRNKVADLMGDVMNSILKVNILEPAMKEVSDYLFGTEEERKANGGKGGVFGTDFTLDDSEVKGLGDKLAAMSKASEQYTAAMGPVYEYLKSLGIDLKKADESTGSMSDTIKSELTEETGSLLASYINAIRADVSVNRATFTKLVEDTLPKMSAIASAQVTQLTAIRINTQRNVMIVQEIRDILHRNVTGANRFNI